MFGNVIQTEPRDMYLARVAVLDGGVTKDAPALTVNLSVRVGLAGDSIGGAESMSRVPCIMPAACFGQRMGDARIVDMMIGALNDPFDKIHMGVKAENVAK